MSCSETPCLTADELDDLFYFARVNEQDELTQLVNELAQKFTCSPRDILSKAQDPESGNTTLHYCSANGFLNLLKVLLSFLDAGPQANGQDSETRPSVPMINTANKQGNTPLHWASLNGHLDVVKALVEAGANLSAKNAAGHSAAFEAERAGKGLVVEYLLEVSGLDMDPEDLPESAGGNENGTDDHEHQDGGVEIDMENGEPGPSG